MLTKSAPRVMGRAFSLDADRLVVVIAYPLMRYLCHHSPHPSLENT
jgi:hypothetical protein